MKIQGRGITLTAEQVEALDHLKKAAEIKRPFAELIANFYNSEYKCDLRFCLVYATGGILKDGLELALKLAALGIESHEYLGETFVRKLIADWDI